jgi:bleomycin hydrolase
MSKRITLLGFIVVFSILSNAQTNDKGIYLPKKEDKAIKELQAENKTVIDTILKKRKEHEKKLKELKEKNKKKYLSVDFSSISIPKSPEVFKSAFYFDPVPQYLTGTCWAFANTSLMESETYRITGKKIKLSEIHTVYYEYLEKVNRFIDEYGNSLVAEGSEHNALTRIWKKYGAVPESVYNGLKGENKRHNHALMIGEINKYLNFVKKNNLWDKKIVLATVKAILDKYIGTPPKKFNFEGKEYTPVEFMNSVLKINPDDYLNFCSFLYFPFYEKGEYTVPDNWWHSKDYMNLPLDEYYSVFKNAIKNGYTATFGGDVSDAGIEGLYDAAIVPDFDIPNKYINQYAREYRFKNHTTTDDHAVHVVGYYNDGTHDWFLIKDSNRSSRKGKFKGYYFFRGDYIKLKMLSLQIHKSAVPKEILKKFDK